MDGMNGLHRHEGARAKVSYSQAVPVHLRGHVREVSGLVCDEASRGKGHATALMRELMQQADDLGLTLLVVVAPFSDGPMGEQQLTDWYSRMGFRILQHKPAVMARPPHGQG